MRADLGNVLDFSQNFKLNKKHYFFNSNYSSLVIGRGRSEWADWEDDVKKFSQILKGKVMYGLKGKVWIKHVP